jgi:hypothetical protein
VLESAGRRRVSYWSGRKIGTSSALTIATMMVKGTPTFTKSPKLYGPGPTTSVFIGEGNRRHESRGRGQRDGHRKRLGRVSEVLGDGHRHRRNQHGCGRI